MRKCCSANHAAKDCHGDLWQCADCGNFFCFAEGQDDDFFDLCDSCWAARFGYLLKPYAYAPDWDEIPVDFRFVAVDPDATITAFTHQPFPNLRDRRWNPSAPPVDEISSSMRLGETALLPTQEWHAMLFERPGQTAQNLLIEQQRTPC